MPIPDFLVQRLMVPGSCRQEKNAFSFSLQNNLIDAHIFSLKLDIDGIQIAPENVLLLETPSVPFSTDQIKRSEPFVFKAGSLVSLSVVNPPPKNGKVKIWLDTLEVGQISFSLRIKPSSTPFLLRLFGEKDLDAKLSPTEALFSPVDWQRILEDYGAWFEGSLNRNLVILDNSGGFPLEFLENYPINMKANSILDHQQAYINGMSCLADTFPKWWPNFGPGIAAAFLGSGVQSSIDTAWFTPQKSNDLSEIHPRFESHNLWWKRILEITKRAVNRWGSWVSIGHADLGGTMDILASLRGTEALLHDLIDQPEHVERLSSEIHTLWHVFYDELAKIILQSKKGTSCWGPCLFPGRGYFLQSDFSYMISPSMFERFVLPDLESSCRKLDYAFYHLDGKGQIKHLDMLLAIPRLRGIQWVPGDGNPPAEEWLPLLEHIRKAGKLVQVTVSSKGALKIAQSLGGRGFLFNIIESVEKETAESFVKQLNSISQ